MRDRRLADVALACVAAASVIVGGLLSPEEKNFGPAPFAAGLIVGLLVTQRRRWPVGQAVAGALVILGYNTAGFPAVTEAWGMLVPLYAAASSGRLKGAVATAAGTWLGATAWLLFGDRHDLVDVIGGQIEKATILGLGIAFGAAVHTHRRWRAEVDERQRRKLREQERSQRERLLGERLRIARELHDVTAHTLAVVGVQLHVAADGIDDEDRSAAKAALTTAIEINTEAINELKATLKLLRGTDGAAPDLGPAPGLADLPELVERTTAAGLSTTLRETGDPRPLSPAAELTIYRVIQESLTNALKHAHAQAVQVELRYARDHVEVAVTDDGIGPADGAPGHGLIGMRERVTSMGGAFDAGRDGSGFTVRASVPVEVSGRAATGLGSARSEEQTSGASQ